MDYRLIFVVSIFFVYKVDCIDVGKIENSTSHVQENSTGATETHFSTRKGRSSNVFYTELVSCAVRYDTRCFVDVAGDFLEVKRQELLAQADEQVFRSSGRSDPDNSPSHLATTIEKLISELSGFFKDGLSGLFSAREGEDDDEIVDDTNADDEEKEDDKKDKDSRDVGESRLMKKKKKKGPLKKLFKVIKVGIVTAAIVIKVALLIKLFEAALKFKLLLVGTASLFLQAVKFWIDFKAKKNSHHDEGIIYKNPYESGADWAGPGVSGGDYHGRSEENYAQNLAYSQYSQK